MNDLKEFPPFHDSEAYPVESSASGGNAYYINWCDQIGQPPPYAACLNRIRIIESGEQLPSDSSACTHAINHGVCPALNMLAEEKEAGKAMFYINRSKLRKWADERIQWAAEYSARVLAFGKKEVHKKAPDQVSSRVSIIEESQDDYSLALNRAFQKKTQGESQ